MSTVTYPVDYYQVNIGVGDCEIILLLEDPGSPTLPANLLRAVLIDGGQDGGRITNIQATIRVIEDKYSLKAGSLKFDAMVITHWDTDHYVGILKMLTNDLDVQLAAGVSGTSPLQVSFLKYDDAGNPLSVLYIPYEEDKEKNIPGKLDIVYSTVESKRIMGFKGDRKGNICKVVADMTKVAKTTLNGDPSELQSADSSNVIGRELFSGELVDGARSATSPQNLIDVYKAHGSFYKGDRPGLFCVAANNRYLPCGAVEKHTPHSYTNRSSIVCLIIRPPSTDLPNGAVSHYLAGDAESDLEAGVVKWTRLLPIPSRTTERPNIPDTVPIVKASHHGAPTSFPLNMCQTFKPSVILFSAGNKHRHPCKSLSRRL